MTKFMQQHKQQIRCVVLILVSAILMLYNVYKLGLSQDFDTMQTVVVALFAIVSGIALCYIVLLQFLSFRKNFRLEQIFVVSVIVLALGYMIFFAPVAVPDEQAHYASAYRLSDYLLHPWAQLHTDATIMRDIDADFYTTYAKSGIMDQSNFTIMINNFSFFSGKTELVTLDIGSAISNAPFGYLASGLGVAVARILHLGAFPTFYMGRFFNVLQYIVLVRIAMKRAPMAKAAFFSLSMFPMVLHLVASFSYDSTILCISILFVAEVLRMNYSEKIQKGQIIWCAVLAMLLAPCKLVYTPLIFLLLIIPNAKLQQVCKHPVLLKIGMLAFALIFLLLIQAHTMAGYVSDGSAEAYVSWAGEPGYSVSWVLQHPVQTVIVYLNTLLARGDFYFSTLLGGSLGWFQFGILDILYLPLGVLFLVGCMKKRSDVPQLSFTAKAWVFILLFGSAMLVLTSMFLSWTPISYSSIEGVQGRYFLPLMPAVFMLLRNDSIQVDEGVDRHIAAISGTLNVFVLSYCCLSFFHVV